MDATCMQISDGDMKGQDIVALCRRKLVAVCLDTDAGKYIFNRQIVQTENHKWGSGLSWQLDNN